MEVPSIHSLLIVNPGGLPELVVEFSENDEAFDDILVSGFISAITQFLSEILSAKEDHTQFAQESYEGIIAEIGDDRYYCIIGKGLFQYPFSFYRTIFGFLESYFIEELSMEMQQKIEGIRELLTWIFLS